MPQTVDRFNLELKMESPITTDNPTFSQVMSGRPFVDSANEILKIYSPLLPSTPSPKTASAASMHGKNSLLEFRAR